jgi:C-terminal processing protease CtpA/Prc
MRAFRRCGSPTLSLPVLTLLLPVTAVTSEPVSAQEYDPDHTFSVAELREDLAILRSAVEEGHPGVYRYSSKAVMDAHFERIASTIAESMTELDFLRVVGTALATINDGHTRTRGTEAFSQYLEEQPIRLPFKLVFLDGHAYLHRNYSELADDLLGAEVLSINGRPMGMIVEDLFTLLPSDGRVETSKYRALEGTSNFGPLFSTMYGWTTEFELELSLGDGSTRTVEVSGLTSGTVTERFGERYADVPVNPPPIELEYRGEVPILTIRTFGGGAYSQAGIDYGGFLRDAFEGFAERGVQDLIIDVRNNGGGSDEYGRMLFAYFAEGEFDYYAALELNDYRFDFQRYTDRPNLEFPEERRRPNDRGMYDVLGHPNLGPQQPLEPGYRGRVWVLQNGVSFSATGEFTSVLHYNYSDALFVGEESGAGYYGNVSGASVRLTLPNTGVRVNLPLMKYSSAVEGYTPLDRGLIPDIEVEPSIEDVLAGRDTVLEYTLRRIRESR